MAKLIELIAARAVGRRLAAMPVANSRLAGFHKLTVAERRDVTGREPRRGYVLLALRVAHKVYYFVGVGVCGHGCHHREISVDHREGLWSTVGGTVTRVI